jgi:hypothetical protein
MGRLQPQTFVGLNTGLPETLRTETLRSLYKLGEEYKVQFIDELLYMNPKDWDQQVANTSSTYSVCMAWDKR